MEKIIGFIGGGNMGKAMMGGIIKSKYTQPQNIMVSDGKQDTLEQLAKEYAVQTTLDNKEVAQKADILILSIKPNIYPIVIDEIKDLIKDHSVIITIAAGKSIKSTEQAFQRKVKVVRVMPNTPALVGEGMNCLCANPEVTPEEIQEIETIFQSFGKVEKVAEGLMDVVTAISGSSPAYVFMIIEALADGAVLEGMPRDKAYKIVSQAVLGSAKMLLDTGKHPGELKDMVCSPGGTTIEAVASLEENGLRSTLIQAVKTCTQKSRDMA